MVYVPVLEGCVWSSANNDLSKRMAAQREREGYTCYHSFLRPFVVGLLSKLGNELLTTGSMCLSADLWNVSISDLTARKLSADESRAFFLADDSRAFFLAVCIDGDTRPQNRGGMK